MRAVESRVSTKIGNVYSLTNSNLIEITLDISLHAQYPYFGGFFHIHLFIIYDICYLKGIYSFVNIHIKVSSLRLSLFCIIWCW